MAMALVKRVVFGHVPLAQSLFQCDRQQATVNGGVAGSIETFSAVMKDAQRRLIFPIDELPSDQRMLRFRVADERSILAAVVMLTLRQFFAAFAIFHGPHEGRSQFF